ncbi:D-alanyl-D-alanine carboxypeptidase/D-alanyl-D-alanine endopeptidase [Kineococcus radiotolerans]|uniref:D-alanyl-D-alanine carboxypeptidase/D-alanyl-D-alanine-endopeptidase n=1 Tax=Kineococcus radiotolerans (strain ATCC BAA-149 / DSM 14245 / SRS30216) TaxID=266940 RepID=A6W5C7_KINRD|nr:D-alanyl-D-alanine carboxypeptidase/D-alanyl-D-alanine-endopeptidase [Kineococcus radiotolerans]ABS02016.1 D-alanyl-D-alanine carboxypeptidase/D-alanyl-D-alanine-endopeptidase [Kineococcus radiotolerans SRS30216 = ATCC BAA-149]
MRKAATAVAAATAVLVLAGGYAGLDATGAVPGPLTTTAPPTAAPLPTAPGATRPTQADTPPVLPALDPDAPRPDPAALGGVVAPLLADPALGASVSTSVVDALTGETLLATAADVPRTPASVAKLLTAVAALHTLGPTSRATTSVVDGATPDEVVLVAGGDVLLAAGAGDPDAVDGHAGLDDLAAATAAELLAAGRTAVAVRLDDASFTGPATSPGWGSGDVAAGFVMPVAPLAVDEGRLAEGETAPRTGDPALAAARTFAAALAAHGVQVLDQGAGPVVRAAAVPGAATLASVESATTAEQVELMLTASDNTLAEVLTRRVALAADRPATFDDASRAVVDQVAALGVDVTGTSLQGGSGLGRATRVPARVVTDVLTLVAGGEHPELGAAAAGLPVAGVSGTLLERYAEPGSASAAGVVRAKTGTLTGVSSLAGYVRDADGRLLAFAVMSDGVAPGASLAARRAQDRFAAALAGCGCR